jgi:Mn2+/Fe2+ NRAMP family transporter
MLLGQGDHPMQAFPWSVPMSLSQGALACGLCAGVDVRFQGHGWVRPVYFTILASHVILAVAIVPLVLVTLWRALNANFRRHRRIARWAWPIWIYVSITGVVVYLMCYQLYKPCYSTPIDKPRLAEAAKPDASR